MTFTLEDALARFAQRYCGQCAAQLYEPGGQCQKCGALPMVTRHELAAQLSKPMALAEAEAKELRAEAERLRDQMMARLREADRVVHVASLLVARDRVQGALETAHDWARQAAGAVREAERAEVDAAKPAQEAYGIRHRAAQDEEAARRMGKGPVAEVAALRELRAADEVLARYQAQLQQAMAAKQEAETVAAAADGDVKAAEEARDRAVWVHEHPGRPVPLSGETVNIPAQPMVRLALSVDLDGTELGPVDRLMAALPGMAISEVAGITDNERQKARIAERRAIEAEEAKRPRVVNATTALAPGSVRMPNGSVYSPGSRPR